MHAVLNLDKSSSLYRIDKRRKHKPNMRDFDNDSNHEEENDSGNAVWGIPARSASVKAAAA